MNKVKGEGILGHQFYGEYSCTIAINFHTEEAARDVLAIFGSDWKVGEEYKKVLVWNGGGEKLSLLKIFLEEKCSLKILPCGYSHCRTQCKNQQIDNVSHSVDRGASFSVEVEVIPAEQTSLF